MKCAALPSLLTPNKTHTSTNQTSANSKEKLLVTCRILGSKQLSVQIQCQPDMDKLSSFELLVEFPRFQDAMPGIASLQWEAQPLSRLLQWRDPEPKRFEATRLGPHRSTWFLTPLTTPDDAGLIDRSKHCACHVIRFLNALLRAQFLIHRSTQQPKSHRSTEHASLKIARLPQNPAPKPTRDLVSTASHDVQKSAPATKRSSKGGDW